MSKEELLKILKAEASVPSTQVDNVLDAMVAAYNKAVEDCEKEANNNLDWGWITLEQLKIKD